MRLARLSLAFAVFAAAACAAPLAAQAPFTYQELAWGADPQTVEAAMAEDGFAPHSQFAPMPGERLYEAANGNTVFASFADDRLVGVTLMYFSNRDGVRDFFATWAGRATQTFGEPTERTDERVSWRRGETAFKLELGESGAGATYVVVQWTGPGFEAELERRRASQ